MEQQWQRLDGTVIRRPIDEEIRSVLATEKAMGHEVKVCIGTDSEVKAGTTSFATVIVFIRKGKGGFMFINSETTRQKMSIKERMLTEVSRSVTVAYELGRVFTLYGIALEVHADINTDPGFKSHGALKDAMGYILGMGFAFRAKPDAFASSCCADKVV
jgi:predicted RNase H-related nuclease YkuK (DUF458 family)